MEVIEWCAKCEERMVNSGQCMSTKCNPVSRGRMDCYQDDCENAPFGSVGGLGSRASLRRPKYIKAADWPLYQVGYERMAESLYGDDWRTCTFAWAPALTIPATPAPAEGE